MGGGGALQSAFLGGSNSDMILAGPGQYLRGCDYPALVRQHSEVPSSQNEHRRMTQPRKMTQTTTRAFQCPVSMAPRSDHEADPWPLLVPGAGSERSSEISGRNLHHATMPHPKKDPAEKRQKWLGCVLWAWDLLTMPAPPFPTAPVTS